MLHAGRTHTLTVNRLSEFGLYLADEEGNEVLLPNRYVSLEDKVGDAKEVFVYHDSEDRLVATTERPLLQVGQTGFLKVVDKTLHGAFLDWGLFGKDVFLPNRNQQGGVLAGRHVLVYLYEDNVTGRCVATCKLKPYIHNDGGITLRPREEVDALVASESPIGWRAIVNDRYWGMIYRNQVFRDLEVGDRVQAYVARITDDERIDLTLQLQGLAPVQRTADELYALLERNDGRLDVGDRSEPERIAQRTGMSKKTFKRALGMLLSQGRAELDGEGIKIVR